VLLSDFLDRLWADLEDLYAEELPSDSLTTRRRTLLHEAAQGFQRDYTPAMLTRGFARYDPTQINNAVLISRHLYFHRLRLLQEVYEQSSNLNDAFQQVANAVRGAAEPWVAVESLVKEGG
ncbi:MAG: aminopeptidase, partial [Planctomycetota bacterium]|jgi:hypothetical protein